jgi:hypothetical protein
VFNAAAVWLNTGAGLGARADYLTGGLNPGRIAAADLDADGDMDIVVLNQDSNTVSTMENTGTGAFAAGVAMPAGINPGEIALGDIDSNGGVDIAVSNRDSDSVSLFLNQNGSGPCSAADLVEPFGELNFFDVSAYINAFSAGDPSAELTGDGMLNFFDVSAYIALFGAGCP